MDEQINVNEEQKFIENLVTYGKEVSMAAAKDKQLEDKIKRLSSYWLKFSNYNDKTRGVW